MSPQSNHEHHPEIFNFNGKDEMKEVKGEPAGYDLKASLPGRTLLGLDALGTLLVIIKVSADAPPDNAEYPTVNSYLREV